MNKNPSLETRFQGKADVGGVKPIAFKIGEPYRSILMQMKGDRSEYIRQALIEKMKKDGLI